MAMAITLAIARDRATGRSRPLYFGQGRRIIGMAEIWKRAKKEYLETVRNHHPDASVLLKAENNIRRNFSRILLKTSVKYGNIETKRVKREEGNKGYLNILWDYAGSRIRDTVNARYFFSKPVPIEKSDGSSALGYPGSTKLPIYPVRHNHLPELDFGDMIRSPLMELVRQCLKYGVPIKEAKKYIDSLLYRVISFMDYVYTQRRSGRSNYVRDGLKELRTVVDQIKREHGTRNGQRQSITSEVHESLEFETHIETDQGQDEFNDLIQDDDESTQDKRADDIETHFLKKAITSVRNEGAVLDDFLQDAEELLNNDTLTIEDSDRLLRQAQEQSRRIGSRLHRFVAKNFQSPFSLNGIIYHGAEMAYDDSGLVLFSEVSVDRGRGRIDLVLARARQLPKVDGAPSRIFYEPFLIADLKSKNAFDFDIYGMRSRSTATNSIVSEFVLERRPLTNEEWWGVLANTPDKNEEAQLDAYETGITTDYQNVMRKDVDPQMKLAKAVIVVDSFQDWRDISEAILPLIMRAYNGCVDGTLSEGDFLLPSNRDTHLRIAMKMLSVVRPATDTVSIDTPIPLKPFSERVEDQKEFILYLTVPGSGSPAQSAAAIAERWHSLDYVYGLAKRRHRDVYWLDLVGEYNDPILRKKQFRLRYQTDPIRRFFKHRVQMKDLSDQVKGFVYEGESIRNIRICVRNILRESRYPIIVVSGWETLRRSTPAPFDRHLDEVAATLMHALPDRCTILWSARPVPIAQSSTTYSTRCVAPFYQGTLWQNYVSTIIWNVVMPPNRTGARVPTNDHERAIFMERPREPLERTIIEIDPLRGWGARFRSGGRKRKLVHHMRGGLSSDQSSWFMERQLESAMELIPHLLSEHEYNPRPHSNLTLDVEQVSSGYDTSDELPHLLSFKPTQVYAQKKGEERTHNTEVDGRFRTLSPIAAINRKREYREMVLDVPPPKRTTRPPLEHFLNDGESDVPKIVKTEFRYLKEAIQFLRRDIESHLMPLLDELSKALDSKNEEDNSVRAITLMNRLRLIRQILETNILSKELWMRLLPHRSFVPRNLTVTQREHVTTILKRHPDILLITGNHLFLLTLVALGPLPDISFTDTLRSLWDYTLPWHLKGLGFRTIYPKNHRRGRSVLDRHRLLRKLEQRIVEHNKAFEKQTSLANVRFGEVICLPSSGAAGSVNLWLLFQRRSGIYGMNAALLNPRGIDPSLSLQETLREIVSEKTYWSESNLNLLRWHAKLQGNEVRIPVMIADQQGLQTLWMGDRERNAWTPVGRVQYTTRQFEDVTLVRTISLSSDPHLQPVHYDDVRQPIHRIRDMVDTALLILDHGLDGCTSVVCEVSLDAGERMYKVTFTDQDSGKSYGELLINRTVDLLEVLRRPDTECEPVLLNGKRLIWNRFRDITYAEDVALLRPWVDRKEPFKGLALKHPPTAKELLEARKEFDFVLELYHDPWTCPLRHTSLEAIQTSHNRAQAFGRHYLLRYASHWAEPERVSNEPGVHHGSCWRIHIDTPHTLTPELRELLGVRFTDAQIKSLLSPQELVYWSRENQEWVTHTFRLVLMKECIEEVKESWHLRMMLEELRGQKFEQSLPGAHLANPDRWSPLFFIDPENVVVRLREKDTGSISERVIQEQNVALRPSHEVQELLEIGMKALLEECRIRADRRLTAAIREEIAASIEISGVKEDRATVELDYVTIGKDSVGGRAIYVVLTSETDTHEIAVTRHLHDIRAIGRFSRDEFEREVTSILGEFNLSDADMERALRECVKLMKQEKLIRR
jgi:hypothetical protein